ncbi:MAG: DUF4826 family protein [Xanthomonadales bacterium]|nr:DUF4826 family protein [Xanthomonadales bacterium]
MTNSKAELERVALKDWYKPLLDAVVKEMLARKAVVGTAVEATPVWMFPHKILLAKVWGTGQKTRFIWTISGKYVITDYIAGSTAATPKDAVRYFGLKWQMDAERLFAVAKSPGSTADSRTQMEIYANKLVQDGESLYDLTERDDIWS